jgi:autotransporter-associated beta strand protein
MHNLKILVVFILFSMTFVGWGQQNVFSRSESNTGDWGSANLPWFYETSNNSLGDPDNDNTTRNYVKIGHNNNTTMVTNVRFYGVNSLDFQAGATSPRTINNAGGGLSASGGIYNLSSATHTFNTPIGIDGTTVQIHTNSSGGFVFTEAIFINANTIQFGNSGTGDITVNGTMQGTGNVQKIGTNTLIVTGSHTYSGTTSVDAGVLRLQGDLSDSDVTVKANATLEIDASLIVKSITVEAGGYLQVNAGHTLTLTNDLTLKSTSALYSNLIANGTITGTIKYERFVNTIGNASSNGGNDLISAPVGTATFPDYLFQNLLNSGSPLNSGVIASSGFQFAFAPFNNSSVAYENYISTGTGNPPAPNSAQTIVAGKGYRVASTSGTNVTFIGPFLSTAVSIDISSPTNGSQWNLIGNPYPSYISSAEFLSTNTALLDATILDPSATAIYGYNSGTVSGPGIVGNFTIINGNTNSSLNIAPGQGFFVASNAEGGTVQFLPSMRTITGTDDFIQGRSASQNYKLILELDTATTFSTSFYFNANSSRGLDPGYDAAAFGENANNSPIYSHLVEDNTGRAMAMQSLSETDFTDIVIPLGVHSDQGTQLIFSIGETTLPSAIQVYLEDQVTHTTTLLNTSDYVLTPTTNLSGTGRFFLRFFDNALSDIDNTFDALNIYANNTTKTIVIAGQLLDATLAHIYDLQGRLVTKTRLKTDITNQSIDTSNLSTGVYVIQLESAALNKSQKIIIR